MDGSIEERLSKIGEIGGSDKVFVVGKKSSAGSMFEMECCERLTTRYKAIRRCDFDIQPSS